jgi:hypothetical protein
MITFMWILRVSVAVFLGLSGVVVVAWLIDKFMAIFRWMAKRYIFRFVGGTFRYGGKDYFVIEWHKYLKEKGGRT